jgi:predicted HD superfamily hydrolase involved in NAD metabolism
MNSSFQSLLSPLLSPSRVRHSLAVARWAVTLASLHGVNPEQAERAGVFHDVAKEWGPKRLVAYVRRYRIRVPHLKELLSRGMGGLLHGYVAAHWARRQGYARDGATRSAMARHTLGHPCMSLLDKILYVADFSSPDRRYTAAARVRRLARHDLDGALRAAVSYKIQWVIQSNGFVHPTTVAMWNSLTKRSR